MDLTNGIVSVTVLVLVYLKYYPARKVSRNLSRDLRLELN